MRSIDHLVIGTLLAAAPVLIAPNASAGGGHGTSPSTGTTPGISGLIISLSKTLVQKISFSGTPVNLGSSACGSLNVTSSSACEVVADASCLAGCTPENFTTEAYNECSASCNLLAGALCKVNCNPSCKSDCMADWDFNPVTACENNCNSDCATTCADVVAKGDATASDCKLACEGTCSNKCSAASGTVGIDNCGVECGSSCQAYCSAEANMDCQVACQVDLYGVKADACEASCKDTGSLFCDGKEVQTDDMAECIDALVAAGIQVEHD